MALAPLAELDDFELVDSDQDCRGWPVVDGSGQPVGTVRELLVDTEAGRVTALVLESGAQLQAKAVDFEDGRIVVRTGEGKPAGRGQAVQDGDRVVVPLAEESAQLASAGTTPQTSR